MMIVVYISLLSLRLKQRLLQIYSQLFGTYDIGIEGYNQEKRPIVDQMMFFDSIF